MSSLNRKGINLTMSNDRNVLIFLQHTNREMESLKLLKKELIKEGYNVKILSMYFHRGIAKLFFKPDIIVVNSIFDNEEIKLYDNFLRSNPKILNMHQEQITSESKLKLMLPSEKALEVGHISWGPFFTKLLKEQGVKENNIYETGSIRLQNCISNKKTSKADLIDFFDKKVSLNKNWILFVSSFSWKDKSDEFCENLKSRGIENAYRFRDESQNSYIEVLDWIDSFLETKRNVEYIYRPHPAEKIDKRLKGMRMKHNNFHIISDLEIHKWISACNKIELWISTSLFEISYKNKEFRILRPISFNPRDEIIGFEKFNFITTKEEYLNTRNSEMNLKISKKLLKKYFNLDKNPIKETVLALNDLNNNDNIYRTRKQSLFQPIKEFFKDIIKIISVGTYKNIVSKFFNINKLEALKKEFFKIE